MIFLKLLKLENRQKQEIKDMQTTTSVKLYSLEYKDIKTWLFAMAFVVGNIVLPQMFHLVPKGGLVNTMSNLPWALSFDVPKWKSLSALCSMLRFTALAMRGTSGLLP